MLDELPDIGDPGFFTWPGCALLFVILMAGLRTAMGVFYTLQEYTEGLLLVIIFMLAALLAVTTQAR